PPPPYPLSLHDALPICTVVEIGPGQGVLTELLATRAGRVMAVELDRVLAAQLGMKFSRQNVEIVEANILDVSLAGLVRRRTQALDRKSTRLNSSHVKIS